MGLRVGLRLRLGYDVISIWYAMWYAISIWYANWYAILCQYANWYAISI